MKYETKKQPPVILFQFLLFYTISEKSNEQILWSFARPKNIPFPTNPNNYFFPFFNACHWVKFQKTLKNRFRENLKSDPFTPFWALYEFSLIIRNGHFKGVSVIRYNIRKKTMNKSRKSLKCWFWGQKLHIFPILGKTKIFLKNPKQSRLPTY